MSAFKRKRLSTGLGLAVGLGLVGVGWMLVPPSPVWVEKVYSRGLYPALARVVVPLTSSVPVSLAALSLLVLPLAGVLSLGFRWRHRSSLAAWTRQSVSQVFGFAGVLLFSFVLLWGANYQRQPVEAQFGLAGAGASQGEVEAWLEHLSRVLASDVDAPREEYLATTSLASSLERVVEGVTGSRPTLPRQVKRLPAGALLRSGNATGVVSPWTLEPHVDGALPSWARVAVGAHELAHVAGYAGEADADVVAALGGLRAENAFARYAVALWAWRSALAQLPSGLRSRHYDQLPAGARADLAALRAASERYRTPAFVSAAQRLTYDRYLKVQGVEAGIGDYSRSVDLLIKARRAGLLD